MKTSSKTLLHRRIVKAERSIGRRLWKKLLNQERNKEWLYPTRHHD